MSDKLKQALSYLVQSGNPMPAQHIQEHVDALQAECARLREALENISFQENLYINEDEHRAFLICKKLADEALKLMPVQTESGDKK